jgi:hypothetical protein
MDLEQEVGPRPLLAEGLHWGNPLGSNEFDKAVRHSFRCKIWLDRLSYTISRLFLALAECFDPRRTGAHLCDCLEDAISSPRSCSTERPVRASKALWLTPMSNWPQDDLQHAQGVSLGHHAHM